MGEHKIKQNLTFVYDSFRGCDNYEGEKALSHYHEAAYDAHMTGFAFGHVVKLMEIDAIKQADRSNQRKDSKEKGSKDKNNKGEKLSPEALQAL